MPCFCPGDKRNVRAAGRPASVRQCGQERAALHHGGQKHEKEAAMDETGRTEQDIENLGILSDFYGVSVDWLIGKKKKKK